MRGLAKTGALRNGPHNSGGNQAQAIDEREARQVRHDQMQGIRDEGGAQPPGARAPGSDASIGLFDPSDLTPLPKPALETQPQNQPTLLLNGNCSRKSRKGMLRRVRKARPGAVETWEQESHVLGITPLR